MTISFINATSHAIANSTTTVGNTYAGSCTPGTRLVALLVLYNAGATPAPTVSDGTNGSWGTRDVTDAENAGWQSKSYLFSFPNNAASTALTVTANWTGSSDGFLRIYELSGAETTGGAAATTSQNGTVTSSLSLVTPSANCAVIASLHTYPGSGSSPVDSGYTLDDDHQSHGVYLHDEHIADSGASGTKTLTMGGIGAQPFGSVFIAAAYSVAGAGSTVSSAFSSAGTGTSTGTGKSRASGSLFV